MSDQNNNAPNGFRFSIGKGQRDAQPEEKTVENFEAFGAFVFSHVCPPIPLNLDEKQRAAMKGEAYYYARAFKNGHRQDKDAQGNENVEPSDFISLDIDGMPKEELPHVLEACGRWRAFTYETASSTADAPRLRICVATGRTILASEVPAVTAGAAALLEELVPVLREVREVRDRVSAREWKAIPHHGLDATSGEAARIMFCPTTAAANAETCRSFSGEPLDVEEALAKGAKRLNPAGKPRGRKAPARGAASGRDLSFSLSSPVPAADEFEDDSPDPDDALRAAVLEKGLFLSEGKPGMWNILCPFGGWHSVENRGEKDSSCVLAFRSPGHPHARVICLHASCKERKPEEFFTALGVDFDEYNAAAERLHRNEQEQRGTPNKFPYGAGSFTIDQGRVAYTLPGKPPVQICDRIEVLARTRDESGARWGRRIRFRDGDGREKEEILSDAEITADASKLRSRLVGDGLTLHSYAKSTPELLTAYLMKIPCDVRERTVSSTGWHFQPTLTGERRVYVLPRETLGQDDSEGCEPVRYQPERRGEADFSTKGTAEEWRRELGPYLLVSRPLVLAVATALAAPCLRLLSENPEGGGFHLYGFSQSGKSTAAKLAAGIYGAPVSTGDRNGRLARWQATANAMEAVCAMNNDGLIIFDEAGAKSGNNCGAEMASAIYRIYSGEEKTRLNANAEMRASRTWCVLGLSTGESDLGTFISRGRGHADAGVKNRSIDVNVTANSPTVFDVEAPARVPGLTPPDAKNPEEAFRDLARKVNTYYGAVGREWLLFLTAMADEIPERLKPFFERFDRLTDEEQRRDKPRAADRFRTVASAFALASSAGILPHGLEEWGIRACADLFNRWVGEQGEGNAETTAMLRSLSNACDLPQAFTYKDAPEERTSQNWLGWEVVIDAAGRELSRYETMEKEVSPRLKGEPEVKEPLERLYLIHAEKLNGLAGTMNAESAAKTLDALGVLGDRQGEQSKGKGRKPRYEYWKRVSICGKKRKVFELKAKALADACERLGV